MQLIGMFDSPYVRRVAITMRMLGIDFDHWPLSIFRSYDEFRTVNPLVKIPTLVCDDGEMLVNSSLMIEYIESLASRSLMPVEADSHRTGLQQIGVALVAAEKVVQRIYELKIRPEEFRYEPWLDRISEQLTSALDQLEQSASQIRNGSWLLGDWVSQTDITTAVVWRFVVHAAPQMAAVDSRPSLVAFSERAEALPEFLSCPIE